MIFIWTPVVFLGLMFSSIGFFPVMGFQEHLRISLNISSLWVIFFAVLFIRSRRSKSLFDMFFLLFVLSGFLIWGLLSGHPFPKLGLQVLVPALLGATMALIAQLILGKDDELSTSTRLTLGGLLVMSSGWAYGLQVLDPWVGLFSGLLFPPKTMKLVAEDGVSNRIYKAAGFVFVFLLAQSFSSGWIEVGAGLLLSLFVCGVQWSDRDQVSHWPLRWVLVLSFLVIENPFVSVFQTGLIVNFKDALLFSLVGIELFGLIISSRPDKKGASHGGS